MLLEAKWHKFIKLVYTKNSKDKAEYWSNQSWELGDRILGEKMSKVKNI